MGKFYTSKPPAPVVRLSSVKQNPYLRKRKSGVTRIVRDSYGSPSDWFSICKEVKTRDSYKCVFCKAPENPKIGVYHDVHHLIPLSKGGTTTKANLATTCRACHEKRPGHSHMTRTR